MCGTSGGRLSAEPNSGLQLQLLGNPVVGGQLSVVVKGAIGQPVAMILTDLRGQVIDTYQVKEASAEERHHFNVVSQPVGLLLLKVSTPTEMKTIKVLKAQ